MPAEEQGGFRPRLVYGEASVLAEPVRNIGAVRFRGPGSVRLRERAGRMSAAELRPRAPVREEADEMRPPKVDEEPRPETDADVLDVLPSPDARRSLGAIAR